SNAALASSAWFSSRLPLALFKELESGIKVFLGYVLRMPAREHPFLVSFRLERAISAILCFTIRRK
ncbi:MAG: hypothetical protein WBW73_14330, partial [Rhodoplanes sp.]